MVLFVSFNVIFFHTFIFFFFFFFWGHSIKLQVHHQLHTPMNFEPKISHSTLQGPRPFVQWNLSENNHVLDEKQAHDNMRAWKLKTTNSYDISSRNVLMTS